jgi:hypothetical protein
LNIGGDKASPYFNLFLMEKLEDKYFPILALHRVSSKHIFIKLSNYFYYLLILKKINKNLNKSGAYYFTLNKIMKSLGAMKVSKSWKKSFILVYCVVYYYLTSKLELRNKLVTGRCYVWSIASYGSETWRLRKLEQKYLESFEMWC